MKTLKLSEFVKEVVGLPSKASVTAAEELSSAIDLTAHPESRTGLLVVDIGAETGSPTSYTALFRVLESDTSGGSYTEVAGTPLTLTAAGVSGIAVQPNATKRFLKIGRTITITGGTSPTVPNSAVLLLGDSKLGSV